MGQMGLLGLKFGGHVSHNDNDLQSKFELLAPRIEGIVVLTPLIAQKQQEGRQARLPYPPWGFFNGSRSEFSLAKRV